MEFGIGVFPGADEGASGVVCVPDVEAAVAGELAVGLFDGCGVH